MSNPEHLAKLHEGVREFNEWREQNPEAKPDLRDADLGGKNLGGANLEKADLGGANLRVAFLPYANLRLANLEEANLFRANLNSAILTSADLRKANLGGADLSGARLVRADLRDAGLSEALLTRANLRGADLRLARLRCTDLRWADLNSAILVQADLEGANLTSCSVYGVSAWNVRLKGATQSNLVITPRSEPIIEVDNLEVAQFIYLLLNNEKIRNVIDTMTSKVVLILGRFTTERKAILDAIREELRKRNYLPVLFDFQKPDSRDFTETVSTLAHMARFIIADLSDPRSIPQELMAIVPTLPSVPVQPLLLASQAEYAMFPDFRRYPWVLRPFRYTDQGTLLAELGEKVIAPAENKAKEQSGT